MRQKSTIRILDEYTAKQIAAGEVIERPACVVRELIDNSIDAGAQNIEVQLINGGLESISISDDGTGMNEEDLVLCCHSHATSKIRDTEDLLSLTSMGFRGEALASISAISKITITSFDARENRAHEVTIENNVTSSVRDGVRNKGTRVCVEKLFQAIPVRKKFLSSSFAERTRIKNTIVEKSAAFPEIAFVLKEGTETIVRIPKEDAFARAVRTTNQTDSRMFVWHDNAVQENKLLEKNAASDAPKIHAAFGLPEIAIKTRKHIHIYINKRPVRSFQVMQAIEYAYREIIHGKVFPQAVVFLQIAPSEVDVNIHPSKQEVRIKPMAQIRSLIIRKVGMALETYTHAVPHYDPNRPKYKDSKASMPSNHTIFTNDTENSTFAKSAQKNIPIKHSFSAHRHIASRSFSPPTRHSEKTQKIDTASIQAICENNTASYHADVQKQDHDALFIGCVFATYAVFEVGAELFFLDFHATHEKKIFDYLIQNPKPQALVVPVTLHLDIAESDITEAIQAYKQIGIVIEQETKNTEVSYVLSQVPQILYENIHAIALLIENTSYTSHGINTELFARKACKRAVKAGDYIDSNNAYELLSYAKSLTAPRCPHGRPLWICIPKSSLDRMIGRIQ